MCVWRKTRGRLECLIQAIAIALLLSGVANAQQQALQERHNAESSRELGNRPLPVAQPAEVAANDGLRASAIPANIQGLLPGHDEGSRQAPSAVGRSSSGRESMPIGLVAKEALQMNLRLKTRV